MRKLLREDREDEEKQWASFHCGSWITIRHLSKLLSEYGTKTKQGRYADAWGKVSSGKGYEIEQFNDTFNRYLPPYPKISETQKQNDINSLFTEDYDVFKQNPVSDTTNANPETELVSNNVLETENILETSQLQLLQQLEEIVSMFPKNQEVKESINGNNEIVEGNV